MQREELMALAPTAQVRVLATGLLKDGRVHSRREIVEHVKEQGRRYGLQVFREGHLAGGVREAVTNLDCEKVGRGMFRAPVIAADVPSEECGGMGEAAPESLSSLQRSIIICDDAAEYLTNIALEINYVTAEEAELRLLERLRAYVKLLREFKNYD